MTTPTPVVPSKAKSWVALVGGLLTVVVPLATQVAGFLPAPWPALIGGLIALLTVLGVYKAPYQPSGTVLVPANTPPPASGGITTYSDPWK